MPDPDQMPTETPIGVRLKIERARKGADELRDATKAFFSTSPYSIEKAEEESGDLVYRVRVRESPPPVLAIILGDLIHNARSALDHLIWWAVETQGASPTARTSFPIADTETKFSQMAVTALAGVSSETRAKIEDIKPWKDGSPPLLHLHRLDIVDKHRLLLVVGAAHRSVGVSFQFPDVPGMPRISSPTIFIRPADRQFPLEDGAEVFRVARAARSSDMAHEPQFKFELACGDEVVAGKPLDELVAELIEAAEGVVREVLATRMND